MMLSLQFRFMIVVIAGATLFAAIAAVFAYDLEHRRALFAAQSTLAGLADAVEKTAATGAFASDPLLLQEITDGLARNTLVATVEVRNIAGVVLARHDVGNLAGATGGASGQAMQMKRVLVSPFDDAEQVGVLHIALDPERVEAGARRQAGVVAALIVGQTALIAMLLYVAAHTLVSKPLVQLGRRFRDMQPASPERLVMPSGHARDEIGMMVTSANGLLAEIEAVLQRERELRSTVEKMEAQYRQIFDCSSAGIFVLDTQGRLINSNPTAHKVIGLPRERLRELHGGDFVSHVFARPERVYTMIRDAGARHETVSADLELVDRDDRQRWVHCLISVQASPDPPAASALVEAVIYDVTERKRAESEVTYAAEHDGLTGLRNSGACTTVLTRFLADAVDSTGAVSVLFIDLDGFKQVNDKLGHAAGDQVLKACAQRMLIAVRRVSDVVGRLGGDEFIVLLNHVDRTDKFVSDTAAKILASLNQPVLLANGTSCSVSASIGIASFPCHGLDAEALIAAADGAMYEAKRRGKNAVAMASEMKLLLDG